VGRRHPGAGSRPGLLALARVVDSSGSEVTKVSTRPHPGPANERVIGKLIHSSDVKTE